MQMPEFLEKKYIGPIKGWHIAAGALIIIAYVMYKKKQQSSTTGGTTGQSSTAGGTGSPSSYVGGGGGYSNGLNCGSGTQPDPTGTFCIPIPASVVTIPSATGTTVNPPSTLSPVPNESGMSPTTPASYYNSVPSVAAPSAPFMSAANSAYQSFYDSMFLPGGAANTAAYGTGPTATNLSTYAPGSSVYQAAGNQNYLQHLGIYSSPMYSAVGNYIAPGSSGYNYSGTPTAVGAYQPSSQSNVLGYYVTMPDGSKIFQT